MVTIRELLNRERWSSSGGLEGLEVVILHRGVPGSMKVIRGTSIVDVAPRAMVVREGDVESIIPYHRVRIIRRGDTVIWERSPKGV